MKMKSQMATVGAVVTALILSACANPNKTVVSPNKENELSQIKRVCVIANVKRTPYGLEKNLVKALEKRGISAIAVNPEIERQRLYTADCPYNLRYVSAGNANTIKKISLILRTPQYEVAKSSYYLQNEPQYRQQPDLQQQTDGVIARLFAGNTPKPSNTTRSTH
ncbi:MAG: hypothetical protein Q4E16_00910 [Neisseria sp.]|nr:hypothetical protein [Neisseria sp.]